MLVVALRLQRIYTLQPEVQRIPSAKQRAAIMLLLVLVVLIPFGALYWAFSRVSVGYDTIKSIALASPSQGWAVGSRPDFSGVVYRLEGDRWVRAAESLPAMLMDIDLTGDEGWAVSNGDFLLHLQNGKWTQVSSPARELASIDMLAPDVGWALGNRGAIVHYANGKWARVPSPTEKPLIAIAMVSRDEGWAIGGAGSYSHTPSVLLHYQRGRWELAENPAAEPLLGISMVSATDGWIVGGSRSYPVTSVLLHYQGGRWVPSASPVAIPLNAVQMLSADEGWAVGGDYFNVPFGCAEARETERLSTIVRYQNGMWAEVPNPSDATLDSVAMSAPGAGWASGWATILRARGGRWQVVQELR